MHMQEKILNGTSASYSTTITNAKGLDQNTFEGCGDVCKDTPPQKEVIIFKCLLLAHMSQRLK